MKKLKKLIAIISMAMVLSLGAPAAFADGPKETPGRPGPQQTTHVASPLLIDVIVYLATNVG